jgi:bile-acid 7alpha-dehydratase
VGRHQLTWPNITKEAKEVDIMSELEELKARIRVLEDIEAIKRLRNKYFRCLDGKLWDEIAECFAEDVKASYFNGEIKVNGRQEIVNFFKTGLTEALLALHHGHHPEIEVTSETTARGTWGLYNYLIDKGNNRGQRIGGVYQDEYVKENGQWRIKSIVCNQLFQETWSRRDIPSLKLTLRGTPQYAAMPSWRVPDSQ